MIDRCLQRGIDVVVEEVQHGTPVSAVNGSIPPRAALVISCIGHGVPAILQELVVQVKAPLVNGEPAAKRARTEGPPMLPFQIVECLQDQGAEYSLDDFDEQSAPQVAEFIKTALSPPRWYERVQEEWGSQLLFEVIPIRPAFDVMPLAWTDGAEDAEGVVRVVGLASRDARTHGQIVRPCFSSFVSLTVTSHLELQALAEWVPRSLTPMLPVLTSMGFGYTRAVEALQCEYHAALHRAPHAGVGIDAAHRCIFDTIRSTTEHIGACQACLGMLAGMRAAQHEGGLFSVYAYLFEKMGANTARGTCALLMMLTSQLFVGSISGEAVAVALMLLGATSIGKTFVLNMIRKLIPAGMQDSKSSKSDQAELSGAPLANIPNTFVAGNAEAKIRNELMIEKTTANALNEYGDGYSERTSAFAPKDGIALPAITRIVVWACHIILAATNSINGSGAPNPAILQRFTHVTGMKIPDSFATVWQDMHALKDSECARQLGQCLVSGINLQCGALTFITGIVPSFPFLSSAFQALLDDDNITPRAIAAMRSTVPAAWIADRTASLILSGSVFGMTDMLIARCVPVPLAFGLAMLQPVAGTGVDSGHVDAFGKLAAIAQIPDTFAQRSASAQTNARAVPPGFVTLENVTAGDTKRRDEVLLNAARNVTPDAKAAAAMMVTSLVSWRRIDDTGIATDLLTMRPPKPLLTAVTVVLGILAELVDRQMVLLDDQKKYAFFPHGFLRWINCQSGPDVDIYDALASSKKIETMHVAPGREVRRAPPAPARDSLCALIAKIDKVRKPGLAFALLHCGAEYPYLSGTADYDLDAALDRFCDGAAADVAAAPQGGSPPGPRDFYDGPDALKCIDLCPEAVRPPRMALHYLKHPAIGVPPSLRKIAHSMRLPGPVEVPLANNGRYVLEPRGNRLRYGDTLMAQHVAPRLDVCVHPNDQRGDALTCFSGGTFVWEAHAYMGTIYTMLYCAPDLMLSLDVTDAAIFRVADIRGNMPLAWDFDAKKDDENKLRPSTTIRMAVLALLIHAVGASNRLPFSVRFVAELIETHDQTDYVARIIRFITLKMDTAHLVKCARGIAERLWEASQTPQTEYLQSMAAHYPPELNAELCGHIADWYARLRLHLDRVHLAASFDTVRIAVTPRDAEKENYTV